MHYLLELGVITVRNFKKGTEKGTEERPERGTKKGTKKINAIESGPGFKSGGTVPDKQYLCYVVLFPDFRGHCFASTLCKVIEPGQSWSLKPFCGKSTCRAVKTGEGEEAKTVLAEEVIDCGPLVDLDRTPACKLLPAAEGTNEAEFPDCCPKYDCEEGAEVKYVGTSDEEPRSSS